MTRIGTSHCLCKKRRWQGGIKIWIVAAAAALVLLTDLASQSLVRASSPLRSSRRRLEVESEEAYKARLETHKQLFQHSPEIQVLGLSSIPPPTHLIEHGGVPFEKPKLGQHRPDKDAVVAFAAEYELSNFVTFIESLRRTGFDGDIVLGVSAIDLNNAEIRSYLTSVPGVVVYSPERICYNFEGQVVQSAKGGTRVCECHNMYAQQAHGSTDPKPVSDPRPPRTLATLRYELYWLMIRSYNADSWILVVDARDTFFQSNPFVNVPRQTDPTGRSGVLYYFGENVDATRLGKSTQNFRWLTTAYGDFVGQTLKDKPTICSGATMGEQVAMEAYVRAIVAEADETGTVLTGADQGFHNFLYYSHKLANVAQIHDIVVFDQGTGIVNNLGAMRTKPLDQWGNGKILNETKVTSPEGGKTKTVYQVLNWDGSLSPVVHQFDRHLQLSIYFFKDKGRQFLEEWNNNKKKLH